MFCNYYTIIMLLLCYNYLLFLSSANYYNLKLQFFQISQFLCIYIFSEIYKFIIYFYLLLYKFISLFLSLSKCFNAKNVAVSLAWYLFLFGENAIV